MKKFLSIFIAMLLIVSLFATTAVAFAEEAQEPSQGETTPDAPAGEGEGEEEEEPETPREPVTINYDKLKVYLEKDENGNPGWFKQLKVEMGDVKFGEYLMKDSSRIAEAFPNIKYVISGDDNYNDEKGNNDKIYVEYCRPSESPKGQEKWQNESLITSSIRLSSSGWYLFRIVIKDKDNEVLVRGNQYYSFYAVDTRRPVVSLSTTMKNKVESGLTAEAKYSIPTSGLTSGSTDEMSSTTVKFKIYKVVSNQDILIYDSNTKEITEGYKDYVDADGAITPSKEDVSDSTVYKVVYSVTDAYGFTGVQNKDDWQRYDASLEFNPVMELKVVPAPAEKDKSSVNVWEIVLFSIAGLSAIGIVILLCIKPKQSAPARVNSVVQEETDSVEDGEPRD